MRWANSKEEFIQVFDKFLNELEDYRVDKDKKSIVFIGHMLAFDKGTCNFMNQLRKRLENMYFFIFNESIALDREFINTNIPFDFVSVPRTAAAGQFDPELNLEIDTYVLKVIKSKDYLEKAVDVLKQWHDQMGEGYAEWLVYYVYRSYEKLFDCLKPQAIVYWNKFNILHDILENMCIERNVQNIYWEHGSIPGTFALEVEGQMGESVPAIEYEEFNKKFIEKNEITECEQLLKELKQKRANRNSQPESNLEDVLKGRIDPNKPTLLYTGQNDFESGILPYTLHTEKYHSPIFQSSDEAAIYLGELAYKNGWNLIYKPHPLMLKYGKCQVDEKKHHLLLVDDVDLNDLIDFSDLVVTILSQCGYAALIREKPVLMLGYIQLKGKGCTYEAFSKDKIESTIKRALDFGYTQDQKEIFIRHVAQMRKYYLFDNLLDSNMVMGKNINEAAEYIGKFIDGFEHVIEKNMIVCANTVDLFLAVNIKKNDKTGRIYDLLIEGELKNKLDKFGDILSEFRKIHYISDVSREIMMEYQDIYFSDLLLLKNRQFVKELKDCKIKIHLFDNSNMVWYFKKDAWKIINSSVLKKQIEEIMLANKELVFSDTDIPIKNIKVETSPSFWKKIFLKQEEISQKYIYVESEYFSENMISNEYEIVEDIRKKVGNANLAIICFSEKSKGYFTMKGYNTYLKNEDKIECDLYKEKVVFSLYSNRYLFWTLLLQRKNWYINMHYWFIGNMPLRKLNEFKAFVKQAQKNSYETHIYMPNTKTQLEELYVFWLGGK